MRFSQYYLPTYKENPADAEIASHQLMMRSGLIKKLTAGVYTFLPMGYRVLKKIENIVRQEMNRIDCQEVMMPILHPGELYEETGRLKHFGPELFKLHDRRNRLFALGPTHEEVVTDLARAEMKSYRQLPQCLYQILTKFRDEIRPRFGVIRAREFIMKDAYSFHSSDESLDETYESMGKAYSRILDRCGLENVKVEADPGKIGGNVNHEFVVLSPDGESDVFQCECGYAANDERAESLGKPLKVKEPVLEAPELVETPGQKTVEEVCAFLSVKPAQLVKTLLYKSGDDRIAVLVPGDRTLNEVKLAQALNDPYVEVLDEDSIRELTGADVGFAGPVGLPEGTRIIADDLLGAYAGMIVGANKTDAHFRGVKMGRDFTPGVTAPLSQVQADDTCMRCEKNTLTLHRGIEIGHIFKLDKKYSESMNATYLDQDGKDHHFIMGCYGFGVSRAVAATIEQHHDEKGIIWPIALTPFHAIILPLKMDDEKTQSIANILYNKLAAAGLDVLLDDRELRPGHKFKDAELIGIPVRITLGEKALKQNKIEIYYRKEDRTDMIAQEELIPTVKAYYGDSL